MVIKTLERVSKNYYYIIRGEIQLWQKDLLEKKEKNGTIASM